MEFKELVACRYSCRSYNNQHLTQNELDTILEAGRLAPTAKNLQEQHVYVVQSEEGLSLIDKLTPCRYGATTVLVVTYNKENVFVYPGDKRDSGIEDASIIATHMMLAAADIGVDSCWINFFDPDEAKRLLGLPDNEEVLMMLDLGHAKEKKGREAKNRKALAETVSYI